MPATADRWNDLVTAFGRRGDYPSWCWCQLFLCSGAQESSTLGPGPNNRELLQQEILDAEIPPGLIAYLGERPVGWTRVGPRSAFPGVTGNKALAKVLTEDDRAWWVTCFAVGLKAARIGGSAIYTGTVAMFLATGFVEAARTYPIRPVVRLAL